MVAGQRRLKSPIDQSASHATNWGWALVGALLLAGLSAYLLYPVLFYDRSLVHSDNLHHSYAFLKFHHDILHRGLSPLWTNGVYAGHPLFAEAQAGLANPINYLVAWLLPPEFGHNFLHWLSMTLMGIGCYGLCRSLCLRPPAALFGALATAFSCLAIHTNSNMTATEAMLWIPWALWAFESWLARPTRGRAVLFGLATAMLLLSGYPHFLHGTVIYMLASLWTLVPCRANNIGWRDLASRYLGTGLLAVVLCIGISAFQWLPLLELASLSHRKDGIEVPFNGAAIFLLRGLVFSTHNTADVLDETVHYFPIVGSLLVCVLASLSLLQKPTARIKGHIVGVVLLLNLGLGTASPIYNIVTEWNLIPGIRGFRILFPYFFMSIIGISVLAAYALESLSVNSLKFRQFSIRRWVGCASLLLAWVLIIGLLHTPDAPVMNYIILALGLFLCGVLAVRNRLEYLSVLACALLTAEIAVIKLEPFKGVDNDVLRTMPASVAHIKAADPGKNFKHYQLGLVALGFTTPFSQDLAHKAEHELKRIVASTNLIWDVPSFSGALALKSYRKPAVNELVQREIRGEADDHPGTRMMDILSIRWVSKGGPPTSGHLVPIRDSEGNLVVWENPYARPLVQTYTRVIPVDGPESALAALAKNSSEVLFVEADAAAIPREHRLLAPGKIILHQRSRSDTSYRFDTDSSDGYWLFLSDTCYPGWTARIDGELTTIYPAQVLGKALYIPPGEHGITIEFESASFRSGMIISALTAIALALWNLGGLFNKCRSTVSRRCNRHYFSSR